MVAETGFHKVRLDNSEKLFYFARLISNGCVLLTPRCSVISGFLSSLPSVGIYLRLALDALESVRSRTLLRGRLYKVPVALPAHSCRTPGSLPAHSWLTLSFFLQVFQEPKNDSECLNNIKEFLKGCAAFRVEVS